MSHRFSWIIPPLFLAACLEAQPKPDLAETPLSSFTIDTVIEGLDTPWSVATLPTSGYLVTEKRGILRHVKSDGSSSIIGGLPGDIYTKQQAGLFDVVLSPAFTDNRLVFISYAYGTDDANGTALIRANLVDGALINAKTLLKSDPKDTASHFGGRIAILPDSTLILTLGDGFVYREAAQDLTTHLGKIVRINQDGSIPKSNPFYSQADAKKAVYSYGHRNVQGLAFDTQSGTLWAHEHGPRGGDELNLLEPGANYGWPLATTGTDYSGSKITPYKSYDGTKAFIHDWVPSIAPSGLAIYRGNKFPEWNGDALVGGLASRSLRRVDLENGKAIGEDILLSDINARIRDVRIDRDGAILVVTNTKKDKENGGGQILRILPK